MPSISTLPSKDAYGGSAKASPLRGTAGRRKIQGPTTPSLQGCLQARPATRSNQSQHLGGQLLAPDCDAWHHGVMEGPLRAKATIKRAARKKDKDQFERPLTTSVQSAIKTATQESGF